MAQQFLRIEIGLSLSGFLVMILIMVIWITGLITIGMALERRAWLKRR